VLFWQSVRRRWGCSNDDKIEILLDPYHDRRNAYRFAVDPLSAAGAPITDEGHDVNVSWGAPWISSGRHRSNGIDSRDCDSLTTLRFIEEEDTWRFNVAPLHLSFEQ